MRGYIEPAVGKDLEQLIAICRQVESNAVNMTEEELKLALSEMHYETRVYLRPELKVIPNENR